MRYAEFSQLAPGEQEKAMLLLSNQQIDDLRDDIPFKLTPFMPKEDATYFDSAVDLRNFMLRLVPEAKPWQAQEGANHEFAHADCALKLGVSGVKYYVKNTIDPIDRNQVYTTFYGSGELPNLAWAAISMRPYDASRSITDMRSIRPYGYRSRDEVRRQIDRWNDRLGDELEIPEPDNTYIDYLGDLGEVL